MLTKKYAALFLAALVLTTLTACGGSTTGSNTGAGSGTVKERPVRADSPLLKVTPNFKGFGWKAQRTIGKLDLNRERVYFFMVDRFADGDKGNNLDVQPGNMKAYNGGDLKGATAKLQYIKDLGFTAIWISPIVDNDEPPAGGAWWFYHGYHFKDPYTVDEHFGKNQDFVDFVAAAHKLGLKVLLDVVVNHSGHTFPLRPERRPEFKSWFHFPFRDISNYFDPVESVQGSLMGAPDFDQRNDNASAFLTDYIKFWIQTAKIDGLRLDTVKHCHLTWWPKFVKEMKDFAGPGFILMGEVWESQLHLCKAWMNQGKVESLVDFPLYYKMEQVFTKDGNMNELSKALAQDGQWNWPDNLGTFVDNHDVTRFSRAAGPNAKDYLKAGLAFIYTIRGFPVVYYGTEVMMKGTGNQDWAGREMMPWAEIEAGKHNEMIGYLKKLNALRDSSEALRTGALTEVYKDYSVYAYLRTVAGDGILTILNKQPVDAKYTFTLPAGSGFAGMITDILSGEKFTVAGGRLTITLKARQSYIFRTDKTRALRPVLVAFNLRKPADIKDITFSIQKPGAQVVILAGSFNGWDQKSMKLNKGAGDVFSITIPMKAGRYEYKFIVDGNWTADPKAKENTGPPYGNSIIVVE